MSSTFHLNDHLLCAQKIYNISPYCLLRLTGHLGSGQFGTVSKGVWSHPKGFEEVAVKTLKEDATQTDKVKFLQEAAIMGQFRHPSVILLYGVVARGTVSRNVFHEYSQ